MGKRVKEYGSRLWFVPDGEIPDPDKGNLYSHEAVIILNPNRVDAEIDFTFYFKDREPVRDIKMGLEAEKMIDIHLNNIKELSVKIEILKPYSVKIESSVGIIVQHSRIVSIGDEFSLFTTIAYSG